MNQALSTTALTPLKGFDCFVSVTPAQAKQLRALGFSFFARYYRRAPLSGGKGNAVSREEAQGLFDEGFWALAIYQNTSDTPIYFTPANARADAAAALAKAREMGQTKGSAIFFAVDCNPRPDDGKADTPDAGYVVEYFMELGPIIRGAGYRVGAYGSGLICELLRLHRIADCDWEANAEGWFGSRAYNGAHVKQDSLPFFVLPGLPIDRNTCLDPVAAGLWRPVASTPAAPPARGFWPFIAGLLGWKTP